MLTPKELPDNIRLAYEDEIIDWLFATKAIILDAKRRFHFQSAYPELFDYPCPPLYLDESVFQSDPIHRQLVVALLLDRVARMQLHFQKVAGVADSAIPMAIILSEQLDIGHIWVLKEPKVSGTERHIEGIYKPEETVLTYDNAFSTGDSVVKHFKKVRLEKLAAQVVLGIIDYDIGSGYSFLEQRIWGNPLFTVKRFVDRLIKLNHITKRKGVTVVDYFEVLRPIIEPLIAQKWANDPGRD